MKKVVVFLFFVGLIFALQAQKVTLQGKISDALSGEMLAGANVYVAGTFTGTFSKPDGSFAVETREKFPLKLVVSFLGYKADTIEIAAVPSKPIEVKLKPSAVVSDEIVIRSIRLNGQDAATFTNFGAEKLQSINTGADIPVLLDLLPSVTSSSDAGTGIGYTAFRLRGTDQNRINVTLNGVPYNDPESHGVYWVDVPDLASSSENIQVQRGVGSSTNGAASFGGSINIQTHSFKPDPFVNLNFRGGSYNTLGSNVLFGTGLLNGKWIIDGRASLLHSDGYVDRASTDIQSMMGNVAYYGDKTLIRFMLMHGKEQTYQAWNGVPSVRLNNDSAGMQLYADNYLYTQQQVDEMLNSDSRTYNLYTYENEIDFYEQNHYHLVISNQHTRQWSSSATAFLTTGYGYYEQKKDGQSFSDYLLPDLIFGADTITETDLIRRKLMQNYFYGAVFSANYDNLKNISLNFGGTLSRYDGEHFGNVIWMQNAGTSEINHEYYRCDGLKDDFSGYAKARYTFAKNTTAMLDLQVRNVAFTITGNEDDKKDLNIEEAYTFFNPKASIIHRFGKNTAYAYFGVAGREPNRYMMVDADSGKMPTPEVLFDYEAGFTHSTDKWNANINCYFMNYRDQLVQTGEINEVGAAVYVNVPESYRAGIEVSGIVKISKKIDWQGNITASVNKIKNLIVYTDDWDTGIQRTDTFASSDISFSPSLIAASQIGYSPMKNLRFSLTGKFVGRQFIDNTSNWERQLHPYTVADINIEYIVKPKFVKEVAFRLSIRNIFSEKYESNAWIYRYYYGGEHYVMDGYFPQAPLNWLGSVSIKF